MASKKYPKTREELREMHRKAKAAGKTKLGQREWIAKKLEKYRADAEKKEKAQVKKQKKQDEKLNNSERLTKKQEAFCQYYAQSGHVTQSAKSAGYSEEGAHVAGSMLLKNIKIKRRLAELGMDIQKRYQAEFDNVIQELASMAFSNIADFVVFDGKGVPYIDISKASEDQLRALEAYKVTDMPPIEVLGEYGEMERDVLKTEIKLQSKSKAIEQLIRLAGLAKPELLEHHIKGSISLDTKDIAKKMAFILNKAAKLKPKE